MVKLPEVFRRLRPSRGIPVESLRRTLTGIDRDLRDLNRHTERDFLQVGEKLGLLLETVGEVSRQAGSVAEVIADEHTAGASAALHEILAYAGHQNDQADIAALERILADADAVRKPLERVQSMVRSFRVMGTLTQIESARLTAAKVGFADLASDVSTLAGEIERQAENILITAAQMRERVAGTLSRVMTAENQQASRLPAITARVESGMQSLEAVRRQASLVSARLAERYRDTSRQVGELVASLQFQDITRQQLEHVCEALAGAAHNPGGLAPIAALQQAQLTATAESFRSSIGQIRDTLGAIATEVSAMARESQDLMGAAREGKDSFFTALESDLSELLRILGNWSETERDRVAGLLSLREVVAQMNSLAEGIQGITIRMQRIALNSAIRAIQIGAPGAALAAVADAIQHLSADSSGIAEEVARILGGLLDQVNQVGVRAGAENGQSGRREHLKCSVEALHSAEEATYARISEVSALAARLSAELDESLRRFGDQAHFGEVVEGCRARLGELAAGPLGDAAVDEAQVSRLRAQYTMQTERSVHDTLVRAAVAVPDAPPAAAGGEFGDNVELF